jgi:hypothetical protein
MSPAFEFDAFGDEANRHGGPIFIDRESAADQRGGSVDQPVDVPDMHEDDIGGRSSVTDQRRGSVDQPVDIPEDEIGNIILNAQHFADVTAVEAQNRAHATVQSAQARATLIVKDAELQASTIAAQHQPTVPREDVADLCVTIDRFARSNEELVEELAQLRAALAAGWIEPHQAQHPA